MTVVVFAFAFSSVLGNYAYADANLTFLGCGRVTFLVFRIIAVCSRCWLVPLHRSPDCGSLIPIKGAKRPTRLHRVTPRTPSKSTGVAKITRIKHRHDPKGQESTTAPVAPSSLAFAPLAYPTIVTPYGIAVLVVLVSASNAMVTEILALTAVVLVRDLLTILLADRILKTAFVASSLNNAGAVGVLQVALGVEVIVFALRLLGVVDPGRAA
jgi:Sodium:alanine symporter family